MLKKALLCRVSKMLNELNNTNQNKYNTMKTENNTRFTAAMLFNSDKALVQQMRDANDLGEKEMMRVILTLANNNAELLDAEVAAFKQAIEAESAADKAAQLAIKEQHKAAKAAEREQVKLLKQQAKQQKQQEREATQAAKKAQREAAKAAAKAAEVAPEVAPEAV